MAGKLLAGFRGGRPLEWANFLPVLTSQLNSERKGERLASLRPRLRRRPISRNGRCERWSKGAARLTRGTPRFEPSGFVCRAGASRVAQRSACASRRFAAAAGSRRRPSRSVGVSKPTLGALERDGKGRLSTLQRVLVVLGAGPYLTPREGSAAAFYTHAGNSSTHQAWETPAELLQALSLVFKRFDLDPCTSRKSRSHVRARVSFTHEDDGLTLPWHGVVFVNPPYGRTLGLWVAKARREVEEGRARTVVALLPARPDTAYWHEHVAGRAVVYFLRGRLHFSDGEQAAPFPSALVVYGATPEIILALDHALPTAWRTT